MKLRAKHITRIAMLLIMMVMVQNAVWAQEPATTVIYLNGASGNDSRDGLTPANAVKTIDKANSKLKTVAQGGTWDNNIIVLIGRTSTATTESGCFKSKGTNPATITGKWNGVDYGGSINIVKGGESGANPGDSLISSNGFHNYISADTKFENLTFYAASNAADNNFIELHGHDAWFGKGLKMTHFRNLSKVHGNMGMAETIPELSIILTASNLAHPDEAYWTRTKPQILTIESGHYGRILGGRYTSGFFNNGGNTSKTTLATPQHPAWAIINIDIDPDNDMQGSIRYSEGSNSGKTIDNATYTCDINCIVAGLTDGTIYGDYEINIHGGTVRYVVGANQGNSVINGSKTFTPVGGNRGNWGQWPNASFFGRTIINVEQGDGLKTIDISNLYAGGLGRNAEEGTTVSIPVDMYFYGETGINIKSGTIAGSVYGGGAGGVMGKNPWDSHAPHVASGEPSSTADATNAILNGVQYGDSRVTGAWSTQSPDAPLIDVVLHQRDADGHFITDASGNYPTENVNLGSSSTTINIQGGNIGANVYGGGKGYVENMPITGAMQGVGSVFGTSNINISGGTIAGSVYGGSEGASNYYGMKNQYGQTLTNIAEMNGTVNLTITGGTIGGGNIFGAGKGLESNGDVEYLRIATAGDASLGNQYKSNINIVIDPTDPEWTFTGDIYGGGQMGAVDGNTKVVIKGGTIEGNVFGGGKGEEGHPNKAKVTGNTEVLIDKNWTETVTP